MNATSRLRRSSFATTDGTLKLARLVEGYAQLGSQFEGVNALARFDLDKLGGELETLRFREASDCFALCV
jgi:hypothetical protein